MSSDPHLIENGITITTISITNSAYHAQCACSCSYDLADLVAAVQSTLTKMVVEFYWKRISEDSVYKNIPFRLDIVTLNTHECFLIKKSKKNTI